MAAALPLNIPLDDAVIAGVLSAGGWSPTADDNGKDERLPQSFVATLAKAHVAQPNSPATVFALGVLVLTVSVAEWGVAWEIAAPEDPAGQGWSGPPSILRGKHLMSYTVGGIGLPHLDDGSASRFFTALAQRVPESAIDLQKLGATSPGFRFDNTRARGGVCDPNVDKTAPMVDLSGKPFPNTAATAGGKSYCEAHAAGHPTDVNAWRTLQHWSRIGLQRRDMQALIVMEWLDSYWRPAYNAVMQDPHGTVAEALVVARIWNSSSQAARDALVAAAGLTDARQRINAELANYAARSPTDKGRVGLMRRPMVAYAAATGEPPG